jgi:UDP-N-acetylmuramate: L-alanyl-gamma-D-glutamyl-meso-diaminopimelate ligase
VIVGNVCRASNPEAVRAFELGLPVAHIASALHRFALQDTHPLVVAGTHGKTTTSSLAAWVLDRTGFDPGFFIGGVPLNFGEGFRPAKVSPTQHRPPPFVVEGDEYDTAFFEKTPKFLHYGALHAIITSIEHDHIDIYPTEASYFQAFAAFIRQLPAHGVLVANHDSLTVRALVNTHARCKVSWYTTQEPNPGVDWSVRNLTTTEEGQQFEVMCRGNALGTAQLPLAGFHNVANALAALAAAVDAFDAAPEAALGALSSFRGSKRRLELLGQVSGLRIYDDFAHHPTAVRTTLDGLRARHTQGRVAAVFEARSATACRRLHQDAYATAFDAADLVLFAPLGRGEIPEHERLDLARLCSELTTRGKGCAACQGPEEIIERLRAWARPGDSIALLSNGSLGGLNRRLLAALSRTGS